MCGSAFSRQGNQPPRHWANRCGERRAPCSRWKLLKERNAAMKRGGELGRKDAVIVKVSKPESGLPIRCSRHRPPHPRCCSRRHASASSASKPAPNAAARSPRVSRHADASAHLCSSARYPFHEPFYESNSRRSGRHRQHRQEPRPHSRRNCSTADFTAIYDANTATARGDGERASVPRR